MKIKRNHNCIRRNDREHSAVTKIILQYLSDHLIRKNLYTDLEPPINKYIKEEWLTYGTYAQTRNIQN